MNHAGNKLWECLLWLGLFAVLIASGLVASGRSRGTVSPVPGPVQAVGMVGAGLKAAVDVAPLEPVGAKVGIVPRSSERLQILVVEMEPETGAWGVETPFSDVGLVLQGTPVTETDPVKLCTMLAEALAGGSRQDVPVLRAKILALGSLAVPGLSGLLHAGIPSVEIEAIRLLVQIGGGEALAAGLGKMLTLSVTHPAYESYLGAFANCRSAAVATWLIEFLGQAQTMEVRQRVKVILVGLYGPEVIESLAAQWGILADTREAGEYAGMLATARDPGKVAPLRDLLVTGEWPELQALAAYGLANVGNAEACAALVLEGSSADGIIAPVCREALKTVASPYGQETLIRAAVNPTIPSAVRRSAVQALARQQAPRVRMVLANLAETTRDPVLRAEIGEVLQSTGPSGTQPPVGVVTNDTGVDGEVWF